MMLRLHMFCPQLSKISSVPLTQVHRPVLDLKHRCHCSTRPHVLHLQTCALSPVPPWMLWGGFSVPAALRPNFGLESSHAFGHGAAFPSRPPFCRVSNTPLQYRPSSRMSRIPIQTLNARKVQGGNQPKESDWAPSALAHLNPSPPNPR